MRTKTEMLIYLRLTPFFGSSLRCNTIHEALLLILGSLWMDVSSNKRANAATLIAMAMAFGQSE